MRGCVADFAYITNLMIASADAAPYGVLLLLRIVEKQFAIKTSPAVREATRVW